MAGKGRAAGTDEEGVSHEERTPFRSERGIGRWEIDHNSREQGSRRHMQAGRENGNSVAVFSSSLSSGGL